MRALFVVIGTAVALSWFGLAFWTAATKDEIPAAGRFVYAAACVVSGLYVMDLVRHV